ncbi:hypothetical protein TanjilG_26962 [Lupinus angustifolius]|uniref:Myeloid leukemia factor n=1 Tax=Lupinus angustifolius TaxID=3871 RepID=A0A1J7G463_LUPAN|nr:PREDICTED: uncharacterized protein LOC109341711 [Lupinus angustifolius]OIV89121.1 hypothetical protein TanjilG_26962 [Lupinus angustifolius]
MQRGRGGRDPFSDFGDPFAGFGGFGSFGPPRSLISNFFGGRDPFDDPFFTRPFGGMLESSPIGGPSGFPSPFGGPAGFTSPFGGPSGFPSPFVGPAGFTSPFGGPAGFPFPPNMRPSGLLENQAPQPSRPRGPIIEELNSDDENADSKEENKGNPRKHGRSDNEQVVEHPDDGLEGKKSRHLPDRNEYNRLYATAPQPQAQSFCFQSSAVSYGGPNGTYYTSSQTKRTGSDGVTFEERKEADSSTMQASHAISRGLHGKGHSLSRKLNADGKVDTMQMLHNLNEDELAVFEEEWKGKGQKYLTGWTGNIGASHGGQAEQARQGVRALPSSEHRYPVGTMPDVRYKVGSSRSQERARTYSSDKNAYHP